MRGKSRSQPSMLALVSLESLVPARHPLRKFKPLVDGILRDLSPEFDAMYSADGRPSIPPERLLKAVVLMALYSVRSERQFCEQLGYNMLFRWFLDMDMTDKAFAPTVFTKNRERLMTHEVADRFLGMTVALARERHLLSEEHFSVDGTLIEAWASMKSFRPKDDDDSDNNGFSDFKGSKRSNQTHESKTDPEAKLYRKGKGKEAKLCFMGHALMENRNGLIVDFEVTEANGYAERRAANKMLKRLRKRRAHKRRLTVAADAGYDTRDFVADCRALQVTPHVAQKKRYSAIDGRTTRHTGYAISIGRRRFIESIFGWAKQIGGLRRSRFRGRRRTDFAGRMAAATFNLLRITRLAPSVSL
ncbi:MAG: IS5 family transposase [Lentisphaerae bacterium]|nr:IS5 family transposase [Lentisphaerota bacterium]MCP4810406.1 IS5 family transposase [Pseudomonadota bacterium]